jgi:hypothetical protein
MIELKGEKMRVIDNFKRVLWFFVAPVIQNFSHFVKRYKADVLSQQRTIWRDQKSGGGAIDFIGLEPIWNGLHELTRLIVYHMKGQLIVLCVFTQAVGRIVLHSDGDELKSGVFIVVVERNHVWHFF